MIQILNTWRSKPEKLEYYQEGEPVYKVGEYAIYKQFEKSYLYTYKNIAINCLCGLNKEHLDNLAKGIARPENDFLYYRALETKQIGIDLLTIKTV